MNQLLFPLPSSPSHTQEDYVVTDSNRLAHDWIMRWPHWSSHALWLYGEAASGKTHLANIWATRANAAHSVPASTEISPKDWLNHATALVIDGDWSALHEPSLFHLLNHAKEQGTHLLLVHREAPAHTAIALPDLRSRLMALPTIALHQPDDTLLRAVIMKQLADRQLSVDPDVISYLLTHTDRSFEAIATLVARLDDASLQHQRGITLPFVRSLLTKS